MTLFSWKETLRELFKTTIIGGASFLLPVALVICIATGKANCRTHFTQPSSRSFGRCGYRDRHGPIGCGIGLNLIRRRYCRPYGIWPAHHSLVGKLFPRSFPALSDYKEYGRGPCTHRKYKRIKAS